MEHTKLTDLIWSIENGTNLHICVVFFDNYGNIKTKLQPEHTIHSKPYCTFMKTDRARIDECVKCRNLAIEKVISEKHGHSGLCCNGVYEYCHPVIKDDNVIAVIFIGNIINTDISQADNDITRFADTFEFNFSEENCKKISGILQNQILLLLDEYSDISSKSNAIIANIKIYLEEMLFSDVSVSDLAKVFHYNPKYFGKLFKKHTGKTINEYVNEKRLNKAATLLSKSERSVTDIAGMTGFNNVTYFNKLFKKAFSVTPLEYREQKRGLANN